MAVFPLSRLHGTANQVGGNPAFLFRQFRQIRFAKTAITVRPKQPIYIYKEVQVIQYNNHH